MVKSRDDSSLNTGMSSALQRRRYAKQEELHEKRKREKEATAARLSGLTTQGDIVVEWLEQELADVKDFTKMTTEFDPVAFMKQMPLAQRLNVSSAELLQAQTIARLMHIEWLEKARTRAKNHLKKPKREAVKDGDSFEEEK